MTDRKTPTGKKAVGTFTATQNNLEIFNADVIYSSMEGRDLHIRGFMNFGEENERIFFLWIDPATPGGEHDFERGEKLSKVEYRSDAGMAFAYKGTFTADLNNIPEKYKIHFTLFFGGNVHPIIGELDITG
jgi:hypothetical protein